jgi:hypothetical protein
VPPAYFGKRCPLVLDTGLRQELCIIVIAHRCSTISEKLKSVTVERLDDSAFLHGECARR